MRTCSKEQQPAGLATTPSKANIAGAPRLSCVKKFGNHGLGGELPYLFDNRSRPQDSTFLNGSLGACSVRPRFLQNSFGPCPQDDRSGLLLSLKPARRGHLISTVAPASVNFFLIVSASSLETPSFTVFGAPSTRSLASFNPRLVTSRTALITLILLAPAPVRTTANSVFSSAGAAAAPPPPAIITGAAAAAETPRRSSSFFTSWAASSRLNPTIESSNCCRSAMCISTLFQFCADSQLMPTRFQCAQTSATLSF